MRCVPTCCCFVSICRVEYRGVIPGLPDDLQPQREAIPIKTTWDAHGRKTIVVRKYRIFRGQRQRVDAYVLDGRNTARRGRQQKNVNVFEGLSRNRFSVGFDIAQVTARAAKGSRNSLHGPIEATDYFDGSLESL